ncbi:MAG: dihydroxyacetone kinase subunit DhaK [Chloroflexota bacterium]|nr:dihydroxyacetone kinase subunit DhaK [Chloroflexota bacterium]
MSARAHKLINQPQNIVSEMLDGFCAAYGDIARLTDEGLVVRATPKAPGKVALVIGCGSGHEPAMIGWIGEGLFDVNIAGEIFTAPGPERILQGIKAADRGAGVLVCVSHHAGDLLNAELALELCELEGIANVDMVVLYDDISSAPKGREPERRGTAGLFFVWKMLGAFCEGDGDLAAAKALAEKVRDNTRSLAMSLSSCASPVTGQVMFEMPEDEMEIGMGLHGEMGMGRQKALSAGETIDLMLPPILEDLPFQAGDEVLVLLNNSGSLTLMELFILYKRVAEKLAEAGIRVYRSWIGPYATTQEMAGFALSICRVDDELKALWDVRANGAYMKQL